jgi:hypothetical protein
MDLLRTSFTTFIEKHPDLKIDEIVSGTASGPDTNAIFLARERNIPVKKFPADWNIYGKRAGPLRNEAMAKYADGLLALWDGKSRGTQHMIDTMRKMGKPVQVFTF